MKGHEAPPPPSAAATVIIEHPPHVHRLLRLIREGTSSHASRASALLGRYAALCITGAAASSSAEKDSDDDDDDDDAVVGSSAAISPSLILWDLIGRLVGGDDGTEDIKRRKNNNAQQSGLFDSNWSTRCNCAMALEYVAKCLPLEDRRHFFEGGDVRDDNDKDDDHTDHYDDNLWLSVNDLYRVHQEPNVNVSKTTADTKDCNLTTKLKTQPATQEHETNISPLFKNQLDIVIERGRLLLSSSGEQYNWNCNE